MMLLAAAALHAGWNLLLKQVEEKYIVSWWAALFNLTLLPPALLLWGPPAAHIWLYLLASGLTEAFYMAALASAYHLSDFSLVYPIARGAAPAFLALWAILFLGERPTPLGAVGLMLVIGGLMIVGVSGLLCHRNAAHSAAISRLAIVLALGVALLISIYSTIDGAAVKQTAPTPYTLLALSLSGVFFTPFALQRGGWKRVADVAHAHWRRILAIGVIGLITYTLVLNAYAIAQVSYSGAIREVSVVFAALMGWKLLGEEMGRLRVIGATVIFCGVLLIVMG
jgi:drug/metabolite transporter (DMT)-like permease